MRELRGRACTWTVNAVASSARCAEGEGVLVVGVGAVETRVHVDNAWQSDGVKLRREPETGNGEPSNRTSCGVLHNQRGWSKAAYQMVERLVLEAVRARID